MNHILKVICRAIVLHQGRVLLVKKAGMDFWHFPGGKWEFETESLKQATKRELIEETGYQIRPVKIIFTQELHKEEKVYLELFWQTELTALEQLPIAEEEEIQTYQWFNIDDLINQQINLKPNNPNFIDILRDVT